MDFFGNAFSDIEDDMSDDVFDRMLDQLYEDSPELKETASVPVKGKPRSFNASQEDIFSKVDKSGYDVKQTYTPFAPQNFQSRQTQANQSVSPAQLEAYWLQRLKGFVNG